MNIVSISAGNPICIGTSAKTAAANPFGIMKDIIATSARGVFLFINNLHRNKRPIYMSPVSIIPIRRIFPFPNCIDMPKKIKKKVFTRKITSENKVFSMLVNSIK